MPMIAPLAADRFQSFSTEHLLLMGLAVLGCVAAVALGRHLARGGAGTETRVRRGLALAILAFTIPLQVLQLLPGDFDLGTSLPLQVCDLSWMLAAFALWTRHPGACALLYFWATTLVTQAIVTPSLQEAFPDPRWWMFWGMHLASVWAMVLLVALGERPTWRGYRVAVAVTFGWVLTMMAFNAISGANYGYLNRKPSVSSPLDLLGPWPGYVAIEVVVIAGVWALLTLPWVLGRRTPSATGGGGRGDHDDRATVRDGASAA
ncbi:TIGR02206 family membrane protein [Nocardioides dongxiaopingii]|uniref:YwaF family protein n=1 Tax=Nocardioides dongxiaopingii TaxID=2576036 RepID=UPI0010C766AC|nr:TIGR02206 family membrane protein [Nocardioides dongxiaopingii]